MRTQCFYAYGLKEDLGQALELSLIYRALDEYSRNGLAITINRLRSGPNPLIDSYAGHHSLPWGVEA